MILYRYSTKDGKHVYPRGKTEALRDCRKHAKLTSNDITLTVEAVELKEQTGKTRLLAALNGEEVIAEDEEGEPKITVIAEVKGKLKPFKPEAPPPVPPPAEGEEPVAKPRKASPWLEQDDSPEQEYVSVYTQKGERMVKIEHLRKGMKIAPSNPRGKVVTW